MFDDLKISGILIPIVKTMRVSLFECFSGKTLNSIWKSPEIKGVVHALLQWKPQ